MVIRQAPIHVGTSIGSSLCEIVIYICFLAKNLFPSKPEMDWPKSATATVTRVRVYQVLFIISPGRCSGRRLQQSYCDWFVAQQHEEPDGCRKQMPSPWGVQSCALHRVDFPQNSELWPTPRWLHQSSEPWPTPRWLHQVRGNLCPSILDVCCIYTMEAALSGRNVADGRDGTPSPLSSE